MKTTRAARALLIASVAGATVLSGCGSKSGTSAGSSASVGGPTTITVAVDAGLQPEAKKAFDTNVAAFEKKYPNITVKSREYTWSGTTFAAELAGGTLPDVFTVPFTDGRSLIQHKQVADISDLVSKLPYASKFNPQVVKNGEDDSGKIEAVPIAAYGQALHYNRTLFTQAGLDPDKPPTTWDEVRTDAKQIASKTGKAGYATMTQSNTGGWILTSLAYSMGGRAESGTGADTKATVNSDAFKKALTLMKTMRWTDNSMGSNFLYDWNTINQAFSSGQIGMFVSGGGNYSSFVSQNNIKPADYGITVLPTEGSDAGALGGGTLAAVNAKANDASKDAAVKWIDFYYMSKLIDKDSAIRDAKTSYDTKQAVGVPQVPVFDQATYKESQTWIKPYINVPVAQMAPYTSKVFDQQVIPEPAKGTQMLYGQLDSVVQAVLTNKNADPGQLLDQANTTIQQKLDSSK